MYETLRYLFTALLRGHCVKSGWRKGRRNRGWGRSQIKKHLCRSPPGVQAQSPLGQFSQIFSRKSKANFSKPPVENKGRTSFDLKRAPPPPPLLFHSLRVVWVRACLLPFLFESSWVGRGGGGREGHKIDRLPRSFGRFFRFFFFPPLSSGETGEELPNNPFSPFLPPPLRHQKKKDVERK